MRPLQGFISGPGISSALIAHAHGSTSHKKIPSSFDARFIPLDRCASVMIMNNSTKA